VGGQAHRRGRGEGAVGTLILDFDSTLITRESLEELLARARPDLAGEVREITAAGMDGRISFRESLERRLSLVRPSRAEVEALGREAVLWITPGIEGAWGAVAGQGRGPVEGADGGAGAGQGGGAGAREGGSIEGPRVWIVSGGLAEAVLPVAAHLKIPPERVLATRARWSPTGDLLGLEVHDKPEQIRRHAAKMPKPRILVGDGMTDYEPFREGVVDHFIAFTANVRRPAVIATGAPEAASVAALRLLLANY
jgi:D-3-phosphoglycerate dehydrogenase